MAELMAIASMWETMAAWFTPTVLFCVTNLIIAIIFIASNTHHVHGDSKSNSLAPIARVSSFLERTTSMKLSQQQSLYQSKTANYTSSSRLAQSIYLPEQIAVSQLGHTHPSLFDRVTSFKLNSPPAGELVRVPSFLDRVKSFKICSSFKSEPVSTETGNVERNAEHRVIRSKSETISVKKPSVEMKKSRSEMIIASEDDVRDGFDEEVDAKADDFISKFKQQLKLQRLESIVRYNEMLNRRSYK
ncbi:hypothetical protein QVD17_40414 [Tagetes erecta]|uniref:DUF4408 domain-containing protein n=1 Tax=Tagetes erecta TaxID=13708 RepID=A0AAD8JPX1_TARER|nr:hypothetical protein QVD17_40414 [Tagetes erecta]